MGAWKKALRMFLWALTACLTALEAALAAGWIRMSRYVAAAGAAENPYAAEEAWLLGICAGILFLPAAALLAWGIYQAWGCWKKRAEAREER